jgi:amidophosphoribosyltransferase
LKEDLVEEGYYLDTDVDTEVLMHLISLSLKYNWDDSVAFPDVIFKVFSEVVKRLDGSFCFVFLNALGDLVIARDKYGFRPLVIGENESMICVASESKALIKTGIEKFRDVLPGEIIVVRGGKIYSFMGESHQKAHCHFEYVYFSDACSINDGIIVDEVRSNLGKALAKEETLKFDNPSEWVVVPIPSTSIPIAISYSQNTKLPLSFSLIKSDVGRGFINSSFQRKIIMDSKYNVVPKSVLGKKVILIDDSIVRGETSLRIVELLRVFGAKEVHLRLGEMPIKFPCCYGVDFPSFEELILGNFKGTMEEAEKIAAEKINADSVRFISFNGLKGALGGKNEFCFACLNGEYPTGAGCNFLEGKLKGYEIRYGHGCAVE